MLSLMSLLGILAFLFLIPGKEGGTRRTGFLTAGLFIALYEVNGTWYDIGRNDMLSYFLILGGCFSLAYGTNRTRAMVYSACFFFLGFLTKQSTALFIAGATLYLFMQNRRHGILYAVVLAPLLFGVFCAMMYATDGWYLQYTILNPLQHAAKRPHFLSEMRQDLFHELPFFFVMLGAFCLKRLFSFTREKPFAIWEYTLVPAALCYVLVRPLAGAERNEIIPLTLWGCILLGLFFVHVSLPANRGAKNSNLLVAYGLIIFQLLLLLYNPNQHIPAPGSREKGFELMTRIKNIPGEVYIPYHSAYGIQAGKQMVFNGGAFWCVIMTGRERYRPADLIDKIEKKYFSAIILDGTGYYILLKEKRSLDNSRQLFFLGDELSQAIWKNYEVSETISYSSMDQFRTITGYRTRPERILRPRGRASP